MDTNSDTVPVKVDLNIDAVLALRELVGIDSFPPVLAVTENIYDPEKRDKVRAIVLEKLAAAGIVEDDCVEPRVAHWLQCLYRPDVEMAVRIMDIDVDASPRQATTMLRLSLVRADETHVLAVRCEDQVVIQELFVGEKPLRTAAAVVSSAVGSAETVRFDPVSAPATQLDTLADASDAEVRSGLLELGATPRAAHILGQVVEQANRRAEIVIMEHHDGTMPQPAVSVGLFNSPIGRVVATPMAGFDEEAWTTFAPGDVTTIEAGLAELVHRLPGHSWTGTRRTDPPGAEDEVGGW